jgi:hypothetical protein
MPETRTQRELELAADLMVDDADDDTRPTF